MATKFRVCNARAFFRTCRCISNNISPVRW